MPLPFALLGLGTIATALVAATTVVGGTYAAKKIYDAVTEDDTTTTQTTSGPTEEEVKKKERAKIYSEVKSNMQSFLHIHSQVLCVKDAGAVKEWRNIISSVMVGEISAADAETQMQSLLVDKNALCSPSISWKRIDRLLDKYTMLGRQSSNSAWIFLEQINECFKEATPRLVVKQDVALLENELHVEKLAALVSPAIMWGQALYIESHLQEYCADFAEELQQYAALREGFEHGDEARIVVCGLLKAGKSTLLNMLTHNVETELFVTGATRATTENQPVIVDGLCFVDTPGLDAGGEQGEEDAQKAERAYMTADLLLFVHATERELTELECQILQRLASQGTSVGRKMVMVLSHAEEHGNEEERLRLAEKIQHQLKTIAGMELPLFFVGSKTYQRGVVENKLPLRQRGGVDALREELFSRRDELAEAVQERRARMQQAANAIDKALLKVQQDLRQRLADEKKILDGLVVRFSEEVAQPGSSKLAEYK